MVYIYIYISVPGYIVIYLYQLARYTLSTWLFWALDLLGLLKALMAFKHLENSKKFHHVSMTNLG